MVRLRSPQARSHLRIGQGAWQWLVLAGIFVALFIPMPADAVGLPEAAKGALLKGDWAGVLAVLEQSGTDKPETASRLVAAQACLACNRNNQATALFLLADEQELQTWNAWTEDLLNEAPANAVAQYLRGDALARVGEYERAEQCFNQALQIDPRFGLAWVARGAAKASTGQMEAAYLDLTQATRVEPNLADAHASLGCLEVMLQNAEGAEKAFNEALRLAPEFALAYNGRGCARYGLGKPDEAALDFEMAQTLCPALVIGEANEALVLGMVARQIDQRLQAAEKPGTAIETKTLPGVNLLDSTSVQHAVEKYGFWEVNHAISLEKQNLLEKIHQNNQWMQQQYMPEIAALNGTIMGIETTKSALRVANMGVAYLEGGFPRLLKQGGYYLIKDQISLAMDKGLPGPLRAPGKMGLAGLSMEGRFDWLSATLQASQEAARLGQATLHQMADTKRLEIVAHGMKIGQMGRVEKGSVAQEIARRPETFAAPKNTFDQASRLTGLIFPSTQKWSQMPDLFKEVASGNRKQGPVLLVSDDPIRSFAFERMLQRQQIPAVVAPPFDTQRLSQLNRIQPRAVVGLPRDLDDTWRKIVPFRPPDKNGGAAAVSRLPSPPIIRQENTFTFPGSNGRSVTLPLPQQYRIPNTSWDWGKQWAPKGNVGGVRTEDLEWVFVDKGNWPVITFFSLGYEPSLPAKQ